MRVWPALVAFTIGCSGGFDPARTVGGGDEYGGPGSGVDPFDSPAEPTTSVSTLAALCIQACAHLRAANCEGAPKTTVDQCDKACEQEVTQARPECVDEQAAVYQCEIDGHVTCSEDVDSQPGVAACADEAVALQKCTTPDAGCVHVAGDDPQCASAGFPHFFVCNENASPDGPCVPLTSTTFCCP